MPRAVALLVVAVLLLLVPSAAGAAPRCSAGETVARKAGIRFFFVRAQETIYACRRGGSRAVRLTYYSDTYDSFEVLSARGGVLAFVRIASSEGGGADTSIGWFDPKRGRRGLATAYGSALGPDVLDVAVAPDGTTAVVARDSDDKTTTVVSLHRVEGGRLRAGRGRAFVRGTYAARSLRLRGATIAWRDGDGARSVSRAGEPADCTAGRTQVAAGATRVFEAFDATGSTSVLRWCGAAGGPFALPAKRSAFGVFERLRTAPAPDGRVAFAGAGVAGIVDGTAGTVVAQRTAVDPVAIAAGPGGELVRAQDPGAGSREGGVYVSAPVVDGLSPPQLIATTRERFVPASFVVADGVVTWRSQEGTREVPLGGETEVTCASGTQLHHRSGVRVFEVLDVAAATRTLFACRPAGTPLPLLTHPIAKPFTTGFFGLRAGRGLLVRGGDRRRDPDTWVTFGETAEDVRAGTAARNGRIVGILDATVGPDGEVVFLLDDLQVDAYVLRPTATGFSPAARIGRRGGGYRSGSLQVTATEVTWRTSAGTTVRVAR